MIITILNATAHIDKEVNFDLNITPNKYSWLVLPLVFRGSQLAFQICIWRVVIISNYKF